MVKQNDQPQLFPDQNSDPQNRFVGMPVDEYAERVRRAAPYNPYIEQHNIIRRSVGLPVEPADIEHGHGLAKAKLADITTDAPTTDAVEGDLTPGYFDSWRDRLPVASESEIGKEGVAKVLENLRTIPPPA